MFNGSESAVDDIYGTCMLEMEWFTCCYKGEPGRVEIIQFGKKTQIRATSIV
jgi:hypothetical protein